jgi:predicted PurR-regulated permease PerM
MNESRSGGMNVSQIVRLVLFVSAVCVVAWLFYTIRSTLLPFAIAFVLSYLLMPLVDYLESHRFNRLLASVGVMGIVFAIVVVPLVMIVPTLVSGTQDLIQRMVGDRGTWSCIVENNGKTTVYLDHFEANLDDFDVNGLPIELGPGARDTLVIGFSPQVYATREGRVALLGRENDLQQKPIALTILGNYPLPSDTTIVEPSQLVSVGTSEVLLSSTQHAFGIHKPGYLALVKDYNRSAQEKLEMSVPMLKGFNLADTVNEKLEGIGFALLEETPQIVGQLLSGLTFVIIVPLVLFFFLGEGRSIKRALIELVPNQYFEMVLNLLYRIDVQLGGYIRGMIMSVMIISILSITGLYIIDLEYFLVIGTLAGVANVIPYLGPLIGIIGGVIAAALQYSTLSLAVVLPVVVVFLFVQIMDNVFVAPVVVARSVNLHPLIVIFVVLVGSQLFGAVGMILAVPATAVIKVSAQTIYEGLRSYSV